MEKEIIYSTFPVPSLPSFIETGQKIRVDIRERNPISSAVSRSVDNSVIIIPEGDYKDNILIDKKITIIGEGKVNILPNSSFDVITISTSDVFVENLNISSDKSQAAAVVNLKSGNLVLTNCNLASNNVPSIVCHQQGSIF